MRNQIDFNIDRVKENWRIGRNSPSKYLPVQSQPQEHYNKVSNMFKVKNKDT